MTTRLPTFMRQNSRWFASLTMTMLVIACSDKGTGGGGGENGGTVIVSMGTDASSLYPALVGEETSKAITDLLYDRLALIDDTLPTIGDKGFKPQLAKSWDWAKDSLSIAFHLDPAAKFHDGVPLRASDVAYTFKVIKDTATGSPAASTTQNLDSVTVADSLTPVFWYHHRSPEQFYEAVNNVIPVPEHIYGKIKNAELKTSDVTRTPVGTGRFRFAKWEPGVRIEVIADTANYRGRPKLDRVVFMLAQAPTSAAPALLSNQIDFYSAFPVDQADHLDSAAPIRVLPYRQNGYSYLAMNMYARKSNKPHPILSDVNVRKAISMALDRKSMLANVFKSDGVLAYGPFPTGALLSDTTLGVPAYDTTAAKAALDAAGWKVGPNGIRVKNGVPLKLDLLTPVSSIPRVRYADLIQEQLRKVGIDVEISKETANFIPRLFGGDFDLGLQNFNTDPTVAGIAQAWTKAGLGNFNISKYASPLVESNLEQASLAKDFQGVKSHTNAAFKQIVADVPAVWLYSAMTTAAANKRIELAPFSREGWWVHMGDWSIPASKRIDRDKIGLGTKAP